MSMKNHAAISRARRERDKAALTVRIKKIAREMFVRQGFEAVTLDKIATALEYTRPAIYRYFKDKNALLAAIVQEDMEDLHGKLLQCRRIKDPIRRLISMARENVAWAVAHPNHYLLFYSPAWRAIEDSERKKKGIPPEQEPLSILYGTVEELIASGKIKAEYNDASLVARTLWAGMHGVIMLTITMSDYDKSLIRQAKKVPVLKSLDFMIGGLMKGMLRDEQARLPNHKEKRR
jgi:AcrR family transcriptional regulator